MCQLFRRGVHYLGHIVSEKGIQADHEKAAAVIQWPVPSQYVETISLVDPITLE